MADMMYKLESFALKSQDILNDYDKANLENNMTYYREGVLDNVISVAITNNGETQMKVIADSFSQLKDMVADIPEMTDFYVKTHDTQLFDTMPLATVTRDTSVIDKIRPQYLYQMVSQISECIDLYLKDQSNKSMIERMYFTDAYLINMKKQMVKTAIPYNLEPRDMARYDNKHSSVCNEEYIITNVRPFLRNVPQQIKEIEVVVNDAEGILKRSYDELIIYSQTATKLFRENKIDKDQFRFLNEFMYKAIRKFLAASSYLTFIILKKINDVNYNIMSFKELQQKLLRYHPEAERILHESAMDGNMNDLDFPAIVKDALNAKNSAIRAFVNTVIGREKADFTFSRGDQARLSDLVFEDHPYNQSMIVKVIDAFNGISQSLDIIESNMKDPLVPFDDIMKKANFDVPLSERFTSIIGSITDVSMYDEQIVNTLEDYDVMVDVYKTCLNEINGIGILSEKLVERISLVYNKYKEMRQAMEFVDSDRFANVETTKEMICFFDNFDSDYQQLVLNIMKALIDRIEHLSMIADEVRNKLYQNPDVDNTFGESSEDDDIFSELAYACDLDIQDYTTKLMFETMSIDYEVLRIYSETGRYPVFEDGENADLAKANKTAASMQKIRDAVTKCIDGCIKMMTDLINKADEKANLAWLRDANNRTAVCGRDFGPVNIEVVPYEKYVSETTVVNDINSLKQNITSLTAEQVKKFTSQQEVNNYLFKFMQAGSGNTADIGEAAKYYYKVGTSVKPGQEIQRVRYSGAQAANLCPIMWDYCVNFYTTFSGNVNAAMDGLKKAIEDKTKALEAAPVNESAMFTEAEVQATQTTTTAAQSDAQNTNQTATQTNTNSANKNSTKPVVNTGDQNTSSGRTSIAQQMGWISSSTQRWITSVYTAIRDRKSDYIQILKGLTPRGTTPMNAKQ
jgi:hypothetical protein